MPDSFLPPSGGPGSFDERDLDAVLSGETADISLALRPVADTLAVLRGAAPTPAELRGEAAIMAEYRAHQPGGPGRPAGQERTLVLPAVPGGRPPRRAARHRARRRGMPSVSRRAGALMGVAAAVLIGVVVVSGNLPGPIERITHLGRTPSASPSASRSSGGNLQNTGATPTKAATTPDTTPARSQVIPSSSSPSPSPGQLCQEFYGYFTHHESPSSWPAEMSLFRQLRQLAGSLDPLPYCRQYLGKMFHDEGPQGSQNQGSQSSQGSQSQGKGPANAAKANPRPGASSAPTKQGSGNGKGSSGPGQGSQSGGPAANP